MYIQYTYDIIHVMMYICTIMNLKDIIYTVYICIYNVHVHRVLTSIKGAPADYGVESGKLKPFEKLLQNLEGKLLEGKIFRVCLHVYIIVYKDVHYLRPAVHCTCIHVYVIHVHVCTAASCICILLSLQNCVTQIFDTREVEVTQNTTLAEEFTINIRMFFHNIDRKIGETRQTCYIVLCVIMC